MKKKNSRAIPDFSRHQPRGKDAVAPQTTPQRGAHATPQPTVKPKATSSKSGRRGQ